MAGADQGLVQQYEDAVRRGLPERDYLAQMVAASAGMNINVGKITAAAPNDLPSSTTPSFFTDFNGWMDGFWKGFKGGVQTSPGVQVVTGIGDAAEGIGNAIDKTGDAIKFITDVPRVATTILGLVLIIAGIFALAKGPAVQIASGAVSTALTS